MSKAMWDDTSKFETPSTGRHNAVCVQIIDLGTQTGEYKGKKTERRQTLITWELPDELRSDDKPFTISKFYTTSLGNRSNLFKDLTTWLGKEPAKPFDPEKLIGKTCEVVVVENSETKKIKVDSVLALKKGEKISSETTADKIFFSLDEYDADTFDRLSDGIKKMIMKSPEYAELVQFSGSDDDTDDDEDMDF